MSTFLALSYTKRGVTRKDRGSLLKAKNPLFGVFAKLRKAVVSAVTTVCLSARRELDSQWMDFCKI